MLVACQVFGKLPLWGIQLDYLTFGCDNCYIRLWVAFLLCYLATLSLNELITLHLLYLGWWWFGWPFSYYAKSIIKLVVFFFFYFATLIQHSRHLECLVLGITIIISRNYIIVLYQLVYNPHGFKNWTESWTIFFKILGSTLFLTGFFGLLTSFHWFWVFFQIGLASNSRFNWSIRSSF